jgi:membrane-bound ClpP family serine protease
VFPLVKTGQNVTTSSEASTVVGAVPVFMIARFLTSNWFAALVLLVAAASLVLLYESGKTTEAILGAAILFLAFVLILMGSRKGDRDR